MCFLAPMKRWQMKISYNCIRGPSLEWTSNSRVSWFEFGLTLRVFLHSTAK